MEQSQVINNNNTGESQMRKIRKSPEFQPNNGASSPNAVPNAITRERSFVRTSNQQQVGG